MTIDGALRLVDETKPNQISDVLKIGWLRQVDQEIYLKLMRTHENPPVSTPPDYDEETDRETVLLAPEPYSKLYRFFLELNIDLVNMETAKYQNDQILYNDAMREFARAYHREHTPINPGYCLKY